MNENQNLTWDDIKTMFAETGCRLKETEQLINKFAEENTRFFKATQQQMEKEKQEREEERKKEREEKEEERKKEKEKLDRWRQESEEADKRLKESLEYISEVVGGIGNNNGEMAEEFFYNTLKRDKTFVNEKFDEIKRNFIYRGHDNKLKMEYDIFLFNGKSAAIIEVKYNAKPKNIDIAKLISRVEIFKIWYPEYKNHKIYLGVAAMSFHKDLEWRLHRAGIATIRPVGKKMVVYDKTVKTF